ncbi:MAG: hypothetical protein IJV10_03545 [Prevotella sp.]|nr:hypothetical protein [Prevotella sp.]
MNRNQKKAAEVKKVAKAEKKNAPITEVEVREFVNNHIFEIILLSVASEEWNGKPLEEDKVYHLNKVGGIKIYWIRDNRRSWQRGMKMLSACTKNGMTTPAVITDAKTALAWGLVLIDPATWEEVKDENIEGAYCVMEGHGRFYAFLIALALAAKNGTVPFDYHFVYRHFDTPEDFGKAYVSTNADMTRTTTKDRLAIAGARSKDPIVISYLGKIRNDHAIPKASYFWTVGRELSKDEVTKLIYGKNDAPKFNEELSGALALCYEGFKEVFSYDGAEKVFRGVPAAQWCADRINTAQNKMLEANAIIEKVSKMPKEIYGAILAAKSNKKAHITKDQVIKTQLDKMMTV